jgi:radical SAM superfamily enzyme YgiQ (UPF0313 family)
MTELPMPAYHLINVRNYLLCTVQFSSGCPQTCDYCDIPALYGRRPRHKHPAQIIRELDLLAAAGSPSIYFVDDNFIGDPQATRELLKHLVPWQDKWDGQVRLSCEATLRLAEYPDILAQMRDAFFTNMFCGVETPESGALRAIKKTVNLQKPILEVIDTLNGYGIEVAVGLIMGFDTTLSNPTAIADPSAPPRRSSRPSTSSTRCPRPRSSSACRRKGALFATTTATPTFNSFSPTSKWWPTGGG